MGPRGSKFLGSVLIEVPHVASLCNDDREVVVLRCDSASKGKWTEHVQEKLDDKTLKVKETKRVFICFCLSQCDPQCESQKLNPHGNVNYESHLNHLWHDTNHVDVCCNTFKTLDSPKV